MNEQMRNLLLPIIIVFAVGVADPCLADLVVHLEMEGDLSDASGGDQNGVLVDGPDGTHGYVAGVMGQALDLGHVSSDPGTTGNDYVAIPYVMPDQGSLALWYHTADYYQYQTIFDNSVQQDDWEMWIYDDGRVRFRVQSGTEVTADLNSLAGDNDGQGKWWHIAVTWARDGSSVDTQMYVNGELINQNNGPWVAPGASVFLGGGSSGNDAGIGIWDDVQIYNHVLSDTEVREMVPKRALVMNPGFLSLTEGQSNTYTVALDYTSSEEPSAEVTVTIICPPELSLNDQPAGTNLPLSFQQGNYQYPQTVTVKVIDDDINQGNRNVALLHSVSSGDISWNVVEDYFSVNIFDDDLGCGAWGYVEMDFDRDCYVNIIDFALFAEQWLDCTHPSGTNCRQMQDVLVVAHRGYSVAAPENTIASCNAARGFADMVEFDVRDTADGYLILMHDDTVDRTTDGIGSVASMTFNELRALDAGSWFSPEYAGEIVPLMSEAILALLPDMVPFIERKTGAAALYVDLIRSLRIEDEVIVIAFDWSFLVELETLAPNIITGALGSGTLTQATIDGIQSQGIDFIDWAHSSVSASTIDLVHLAGMELHVWTVNDAGRMNDLINWGVDGITTDNPELLRQLLEN